MSKLEDIIQEIRVELGSDFISTDIVGSDGLSIAGGSVDPNFDTGQASARFSMVMKLASKTSDKLAIGAVEDNLATTEKLMIISRPLGDGSYYWGLAVPKDATLGIVRLMMNEFAPRLWNAIPR